MASGLLGQPPDHVRRPSLHIQGEKVVMREKRLEDGVDDYTWRSDPELAAYDAVAPLRMSLSDFMIIYQEELRFPSPRQRTLAIEDEEGVHIGNCMYYDVNEQRGQAELGIMIGRKDHWSQGYGTDSIATLVKYIFLTTGLDRIYLHTLKWNERAQKAFQKAGFTPIGEVQRKGQTFLTMEVFRHQVVFDEADTCGKPSGASLVSKPDRENA